MTRLAGVGQGASYTARRRAEVVGLGVGRHVPVDAARGRPHLDGTVEPIHDKAMPVLLLTAAGVDQWLNAPAEEALLLQKPVPDDVLVVMERPAGAGR